VRDVVGNHRLTCCEFNYTLRKLLKAQKFRLTKVSDFLDLELFGRFDAVVMNPPFEKGQDIEHAVHAFRHLKPGGRLASVVSESAHFNTSVKHSGFRDWLESEGGYFIDLPAGAFKESGTGVKARLIYVEKRL
jgi:16S rRNA G1207 methylase RsmC